MEETAYGYLSFAGNSAEPGAAKAAHTMRIQIWFAWARSLLLDIIAEAKDAFDQSQSEMLDYYRSDNYGDWRLEMIAPRSLESVYLPHELLADLTNDIETYLSAKPIYVELGIPYRRGYQLASKFRLPVYSVALRGAEITGTQLADLLANCRKPAILAFEDIDSIKLATNQSSKANSGITMADLLNAIDGIGASEDRLLFITANRPEILDTALVRAGRVDRKFYVDYARHEELNRFHERVSMHFPVEPWLEFRAALPMKATIADAQALAFRRSDPMRNTEFDLAEAALKS